MFGGFFEISDSVGDKWEIKGSGIESDWVGIVKTTRDCEYIGMSFICTYVSVHTA